MPGFLRTYATVIELHTEANHNHLYCMDIALARLDTLHTSGVFVLYL